MFVILVYDVGEKRVNKVLKKARKYLNWVQNSVLEGEISDANYKKLKYELGKIMNLDEDSAIIYQLRTTKYSSREIIGIEKGGQELIL
ncbi:CRISPR-associated endonuclease Cas2 [Candidatus Formimonas warabiya]|uniref:CRISPR-associated endoribonuclease Cas2 n=1 Tax=Formimonas warabiya TaxID=1761012 RepID=A0A3G1KYJ0_FORW1|nr:CRISPR-associated endonuclease Cas2 [Candidatus Formimonas warabiya]ATW27429.1 CRISPR-associated endonuclease Cas2 [Candidatus Formimonas warabiya]